MINWRRVFKVFCFWLVFFVFNVCFVRSLLPFPFLAIPVLIFFLLVSCFVLFVLFNEE
jgi:hypothetical protein